jgi:PAS domain S-box-containing protein
MATQAKPSPAHDAAAVAGRVVSERSREEALLTTGALQNAIFNSANFSSIATDESGVIQLFNVGAERMLGYAAADVLNKITPADISDPTEVIARARALSAELGTTIRPGFEALVFKASRGIEDIYELTYVRKDGSRLPAIVSVTALRNEEDSIIGYLLIGTDNTARKRVEAEQEKLDQRRKQVEQMLQEKNVELEAAKSVAEQTVVRLEEVEQLKNGFLSTVSHELRTPLTSIRGALGLLASGAVGRLSGEVLEIVAIAERNAVRLMALINDILDLERLETGKIELEFAQVPAELVLQRAMESVAAFAQTHGVTVEAPTAPFTIWADADRIVQVLVNLLSNAVKFSPPAGVVTIGVAPWESWAEFRVTDRGRGVPVAQRRAIFERFRQVEISDAREKGGTGLGLAICKSIIEQHGGTIGVEVEEGDGSSFWFRVPTSSRVFAPVVEQPIIVCGDRRGLFEEVIREAGYAVIAVPSDAAAWRELQRGPVAAILMNSDSALLARIRADRAWYCLPVVLFGSPAKLTPQVLADNLTIILPQRVDSRELLVTIRDGLERGRIAAATCRDAQP